MLLGNISSSTITLKSQYCCLSYFDITVKLSQNQRGTFLTCQNIISGSIENSSTTIELKLFPPTCSAYSCMILFIIKHLCFPYWADVHCQGSKAIQGIALNFFEPCEVLWNPEAFSKICNLKLLILGASSHGNLHLSNGLNCLSDGLRVLEWEKYPLESMPLDIELNELVDLKLHHSKIKQLWDGIKVTSFLSLRGLPSFNINTSSHEFQKQ